MEFKIRAALSQQVIGNTLIVRWTDGSVTYYDAVKMGVEWFRMSNDCFYDMYGFNFNPHSWPGLYDRCRKIVYPNE